MGTHGYYKNIKLIYMSGLLIPHDNTQFIANHTSNNVGIVCSPNDSDLVNTLNGGYKKKRLGVSFSKKVKPQRNPKIDLKMKITRKLKNYKKKKKGKTKRKGKSYNKKKHRRTRKKVSKRRKSKRKVKSKIKRKKSRGKRTMKGGGGSWAYSHFNHMPAASYGFTFEGAQASTPFRGMYPAYNQLS